VLSKAAVKYNGAWVFLVFSEMLHLILHIGNWALLTAAPLRLSGLNLALRQILQSSPLGSARWVTGCSLRIPALFRLRIQISDTICMDGNPNQTEDGDMSPLAQTEIWPHEQTDLGHVFRQYEKSAAGCPERSLQAVEAGLVRCNSPPSAAAGAGGPSCDHRGDEEITRRSTGLSGRF
jgi:hypothetical protein